MVAKGTVREGDAPSRSDYSIDFVAEAVLIQGFYGLEAAPRPRMTGSVRENMPEAIEPLGSEPVENPAAGENMTTESTPAGIVDLPD